MSRPPLPKVWDHWGRSPEWKSAPSESSSTYKWSSDWNSLPETEIANKQKRLQCDAAASDSESNFSDFEDEAELLEKLSDVGELKDNCYVAVAYQDCWYPGIVKSTISTDKAVVRFMVPTNKPGVFRWPVRDDVQTVERRFILLTGFVPDCVGSGRLWNIHQHTSIDNIYKKFAKMYFEWANSCC